jgi:hypothetical protein
MEVCIKSFPKRGPELLQQRQTASLQQETIGNWNLKTFCSCCRFTKTDFSQLAKRQACQEIYGNLMTLNIGCDLFCRTFRPEGRESIWSSELGQIIPWFLVNLFCILSGGSADHFPNGLLHVQMLHQVCHDPLQRRGHRLCAGTKKIWAEAHDLIAC